jgi:hypothetical protein
MTRLYQVSLILSGPAIEGMDPSRLAAGHGVTSW